MKTSYRKDYCAKFNETFEGETITISGWCSSIRDHGGVIFIDLRDKSGIIQIVSDPNNSKDVHEIIEKIRTKKIRKIFILIEKFVRKLILTNSANKTAYAIPRNTN